MNKAPANMTKNDTMSNIRSIRMMEGKLAKMEKGSPEYIKLRNKIRDKIINDSNI